MHYVDKALIQNNKNIIVLIYFVAKQYDLTLTKEIFYLF